MRRYAAVSRFTLVGAVVTGLLGAAVLGSPGIGYPIVAAAVLVVAASARPDRLTWWHAFGAIAVLALTSVSVFRDAEWLVTLATWLAVVVTGVVLSASWTWTGTILGAMTPVFVPVRVLRWTRRGTRRLDTGSVKPGRLGLVAAVTSLLVLVFAALFAGADPQFERLRNGIWALHSGDSLSSRSSLAVRWLRHMLPSIRRVSTW